MVDVDSFAKPVGDPPLNDRNRLIIRVVEDLDLKAGSRPVEGAHGIEHPLGYVTLVVDRNLDANFRFVYASHQPSGPRLQPRRLPREIEEVDAKNEKRGAGHP
jgi:hypothetical protein